MPCHREVLKRSHVDKTIFLLKIENKYVPIVDSAVKIIIEEDPILPNPSKPETKEDHSKESASLPPVLPSFQKQEVPPEVSDPLNVSLGAPFPVTAPQSLTAKRKSFESAGPLGPPPLGNRSTDPPTGDPLLGGPVSTGSKVPSVTELSEEFP